MSKLAILGSSCFVLLAAAVYVAMRFPIGCLFVPCDRSVRFQLEPADQNLEGCDLMLFAAGDRTLSQPFHRLAIQDHEAEVIVQPRWREAFLAALSCKGLRLSNPQLIDYEHKDSITIRLLKPDLR